MVRNNLPQSGLETSLPLFNYSGVLALTLPFLEAALGVLLIPGLLTRLSLVVVPLLMTALVFGTTLREQFMTVGIQLIYAAIFLF